VREKKGVRLFVKEVPTFFFREHRKEEVRLKEKEKKGHPPSADQGEPGD